MCTSISNRSRSGRTHGESWFATRATIAGAIRAVALLSAILVGLPSIAAALTPGEINYQGLLLDDMGQPLTGTVDLQFEIFDDPSAGTSLWMESHSDVEVTDGIYDTTLGATVPITSAVLAPPAVYLEVTVDGETLTPRQRLLAVPYALLARDTEEVSGVPSVYFQQILQHVSFDGGGPPNDDPTEGLADSDGDGVPNFLDSDNDDDGWNDVTEVANGTDLNLVTPRITVLPDLVRVGETVQVHGANFDPGMTLTVGGQNVSLQNVSPTQFEFVPPGPVQNGQSTLVVELANGETAQDSIVIVEALVFVSFGSLNGAGMGLAEGDSRCASEAASAGLSGNFVVWLSDSTTNAVDRLDPAAGPWSLVDGTLVADSIADLTDGEIDAPIDVRATGGKLSNIIVYTGTDAAGLATPYNCSDWTESFGGATGAVNDGVQNWTSGLLQSAYCFYAYRMYCFESP